MAKRALKPRLNLKPKKAEVSRQATSRKLLERLAKTVEVVRESASELPEASTIAS